VTSFVGVAAGARGQVDVAPEDDDAAALEAEEAAALVDAEEAALLGAEEDALLEALEATATGFEFETTAEALLGCGINSELDLSVTTVVEVTTRVEVVCAPTVFTLVTVLTETTWAALDALPVLDALAVTVVWATVTVFWGELTVLMLVTVLTDPLEADAAPDALAVIVILATVTVFWGDPFALKVMVLNTVVGLAFWLFAVMVVLATVKVDFWTTVWPTVTVEIFAGALDLAVTVVFATVTFWVMVVFAAMTFWVTVVLAIVLVDCAATTVCFSVMVATRVVRTGTDLTVVTVEYSIIVLVTALNVEIGW
jgi:hypothetical protein